MYKFCFVSIFYFSAICAINNASGQQEGSLGANIVIDTEHQLPMVVSIQPNSPAARMQFRPYALIREINGISLMGKSLDEIKPLLQGPVGTMATIKFTPEIGLLYTDTFTWAALDPNPLYRILPKEGSIYFPSYAGDEFKDHFKDSLILILYATKDSFKTIRGVFHKGDRTNRLGFYESHCNVHGSFHGKISGDGKKYSATYAFSADSAETYLRYQYLVHLVQASLGNGFVAEMPFWFEKSKKNRRSIYYNFYIKRCTPYPNWVGKQIAIDFIPSTTVENEQRYEVRMNIYMGN